MDVHKRSRSERTGRPHFDHGSVNSSWPIVHCSPACPPELSSVHPSALLSPPPAGAVRRRQHGQQGRLRRVLHRGDPARLLLRPGSHPQPSRRLHVLVSVPDGGASGRQAAPVHLPGRPEGLLRHRRERRQDRHWQEVLLHPGLTPLRPGLAEMSRAGGAGEGSLSSPRACRRRLRGLEIRSR